MKQQFVVWFEEISIKDISLVGGKNASLGEMYRELSSKGVRIPNGFALTAESYRQTLQEAGLETHMREILSTLDITDLENLQERAIAIRELIAQAEIPAAIARQIADAYARLCEQYGPNTDVAVRSSATTEDLPDASFAGQQETYLNIRGLESLLSACRKCFASLFTERAISYREDKGFDHFSVALSIGVQKMVRSDLASSGVMFSIDTETGFRDVVLINSAYGLGENIVQGKINPDEIYVFKPTLLQGYRPIIAKNLGSKKIKMVYNQSGLASTRDVRVARPLREQFSISDNEILTLARWACIVEQHYSEHEGKPVPMDLEWAKDGQSGELYIVQARPETVVSQKNSNVLTRFVLQEKAEIIASGRAVGTRIGSGRARIINHARDISQFCKGEVLVTDTTDPDWEPVMKIAAGIVTNQGGRTSHAAIVSRELGIPCIVGSIDGTQRIKPNTEITVSCADGELGHVYAGLLKYEEKQIELGKLPNLKTQVMLNVGSPDKAFELSFLPNDGVGLARLEFIINTHLKVHPLALVHFDQLKSHEVKEQIESLTSHYPNKPDYFVEKLAEGVAQIAAAFYPKPVIVRLSDFKSNEYASLLGGSDFEPSEENPMIGWRGASRYYSQGYRAGFALECKALKKVREEFGLLNVKLMIPFCRTPDEGRRVIAEMSGNGLLQGQDQLEIYCMCEIPANVLQADEFLSIFDGFSIGSNDLTQLTLGLDRDSALISELFDERSPAVKSLIRQVIKIAQERNKYIGICGDAPSSYPEFSKFLVEAGIASISLSPDALLKGRLAIYEAESQHRW